MDEPKGEAKQWTLRGKLLMSTVIGLVWGGASWGLSRLVGWESESASLVGWLLMGVLFWGPAMIFVLPHFSSRQRRLKRSRPRRR